MAIDPITMALIGAGAKGLSRAVGVGSRLLQPKFGSTQYGRELKNITKHGMLTPGQETGIIGNVSRTANRQSAIANSRYMGGLINRGMQGSVSGNRGLREAEADVRRTVADTSRGMFQQEESAKRQAKLNYAKAVDKDKAERSQVPWKLLSNQLDTAGDMAGSFAGSLSDTAKLDAKNLRADKTEMMGFLNKYKDKEDFMTRLQFLQTQYPQFFE